MTKTNAEYLPFIPLNHNAAVVCVACFLATTKADMTEYGRRPLSGAGSQAAADAWIAQQGLEGGRATYQIGYESGDTCACCAGTQDDAYMLVSWAPAPAPASEEPTTVQRDIIRYLVTHCVTSGVIASVFATGTISPAKLSEVCYLLHNVDDADYWHPAMCVIAGNVPVSTIPHKVLDRMTRADMLHILRK